MLKAVSLWTAITPRSGGLSIVIEIIRIVIVNSETCLIRRCYSFELGRVISGVGYFSSCHNSSFVQLWISSLRVSGSKSIHPILGVSSCRDSGRPAQVSSLGSVLPSLISNFLTNINLKRVVRKTFA